jgi:hypothetical protein
MSFAATTGDRGGVDSFSPTIGGVASPAIDNDADDFADEEEDNPSALVICSILLIQFIHSVSSALFSANSLS